MHLQRLLRCRRASVASIPTAVVLAMAMFFGPQLGTARADEPAAPHPTDKDRIVFLGDSITDGNTYPLLIGQALAKAGKPVPVLINAGIGGDTAAGMRARLDRDVVPRRPTLVTLSAGINDVLHKVPVGEYERDVAGIAERLKREKVPLLILTTTCLGPEHAAADGQLDAYNAALHRVAEKYGLRVAEVNRAMRGARQGGAGMMEPDDVHLNFAGYRVMTRAILDGLGFADAPVPEALEVSPPPGLVSPWKVKAADEKAGPLIAEAVATLEPDGSWVAVQLPDSEPAPHWWMDQERRRGFATGVEKRVGKAKRYWAVAAVEREKAGRAFLNPGAEVETIWLNGQRVYERPKVYTGWHAGRERVPVDLRGGRNTVVLETGGTFFLSVTDDDQW